MNVEIGAEAAQFPEKEYINGIAVAVHWKKVYWEIFYLGESSWDSRRQDRAGPGSSRPRTGRRAGPPVSPPGT